MRSYNKAILPEGFKASGLHCGIKHSHKPDLALFYSEFAAKAACLFTSNKIKAAPIKLCQEKLKNNREFRAIIANSGNANCYTGKAGLDDARHSCRYVSGALGIAEASVLVASTGIIGRRMDVSRIKKAMPKLVEGLSVSGIHKAKKAIMTTDLITKEFTVQVASAGSAYSICGVAKGAGMISPDMATMLCFIFTDADIAQRALESSLRAAVEGSFNCISVDGCMSTNDTVMILANAAAGNRQISRGSRLQEFSAALTKVCGELSVMIVRDGEGASKFIRIEVCGASSRAQAKKGALAVANSNLFKTAVYGQNPNFGRVLAALGSSGIDIDEDKVKVRLGPLNKKEVELKVALGMGKGRAVVYTSDLTPKYIKINAEYN